jgi:SNF2 family DNA or RNA helicase
MFFRIIESKNLNEYSQNLIIKRLQEVIRPFTLRRAQEEIDVDIPGKYEVTLKCIPSELQKSIIKTSQERGHTVNQKLFISKRVSNSPVLFLQRSHLKLVDPEYMFSRTPKLQVLDAIIQKLKITGHRFLIYSQWTSMMDIIEAFLKWRGIEISRIDGSVTTSDRTRIIEEFIKPTSSVEGMILSTRSSAFGLNLQAADTVILFDSDYNPFVELQASARVHRLGQINTVVVIRLMMIGTGEESILRISRRKFHMGQQIIAAGMFNLRSTEEEKNRALLTPIEKAKEIINPSDSDLNSIIGRGEEEENLLSFSATERFIPTEKESFKALDELIMNSYIDLAEGRTSTPAALPPEIAGAAVPPPEEEIDEFEDVD